MYIRYFLFSAYRRRVWGCFVLSVPLLSSYTTTRKFVGLRPVPCVDHAYIPPHTRTHPSLELRLPSQKTEPAQFRLCLASLGASPQQAEERPASAKLSPFAAKPAGETERYHSRLSVEPKLGEYDVVLVTLDQVSLIIWV